MPNVDQNSGIDPNVDQFRNELINAMILIGIDQHWAWIEGVLHILSICTFFKTIVKL